MAVWPALLFAAKRSALYGSVPAVVNNILGSITISINPNSTENMMLHVVYLHNTYQHYKIRSAFDFYKLINEMIC